MPSIQSHLYVGQGWSPQFYLCILDSHQHYIAVFQHASDSFLSVMKQALGKGSERLDSSSDTD